MRSFFYFGQMENHTLFKMPFAKVYPMYVQKAERKNRTEKEVIEIISWLTGYDDQALQNQLKSGVDIETFFLQAPLFNPNAAQIKGLICGYRVESIENPLMQKIRYLDKLIDELARGKSMHKILRK
jgi:hypothetical protein